MFYVKSRQRLKVKTIYFFLLFYLFLFASCDKKEKLDFTYEEKVMYDSLKTEVFKDIRSKTDSVCVSISDSLFRVYTDSILEVRMIEVNQLFEE